MFKKYVWFIALLGIWGCKESAEQPNADTAAVLLKQRDTASVRSDTLRADTIVFRKKLSKATQVALYYRKAQDFLHHNDTNAALLCFEKIKTLPIKDPTVFLTWAYIKAEREDGDCLSLLKKARTLGADADIRAQAAFVKGIYYRNIRENKQAIAAFDAAIRLRWTFLEAYLEKGALLFAMKRFKEAERVFLLALRTHIKSAEVYYWLGRIAEEWRLPKDKIKAFYRQALLLDKNFILAQQRLQAL